MTVLTLEVNDLMMLTRAFSELIEDVKKYEREHGVAVASQRVIDLANLSCSLMGKTIVVAAEEQLGIKLNPADFDGPDWV